MKNREGILRLSFIIITIGYLTILLLSLSGCAVSKHKQQKSTDSTSIKKEISTASSVTKASNVTENEWWRTTLQYPQPQQQSSGDTVINRIYPTTIIREYGRGSDKTEVTVKDTAAKDAQEVKQASSSETIKEKETKPINLYWILAIWGAWEVLKIVFKYFSSKYTIVSKAKDILDGK